MEDLLEILIHLILTYRPILDLLNCLSIQHLRTGQLRAASPRGLADLVHLRIHLVIHLALHPRLHGIA